MPENTLKTPFSSVFSMPLSTPCYDTGWDRRLKLSSLLRWQQEVGERQLAEHGMEWESLAKRGYVFVLTRAAGTLYRLPLPGERLRLETWQQAVSGASFYRGYQLLDEKGTRLTNCATAFALVDLETHRPQRPGVLGEWCLTSIEREIPSAVLRRLRPPQGAAFETAGEWTVRRSSVDYNGHLNNAVYADLLTDFLPKAVCAHVPRAFVLQFEREARLGDCLTMRHLLTAEAESGDTAAFVEGWRGETRCFVGRLVF